MALNNNIYMNYIKKHTEKELYDPVKTEFKKRQTIQRFSCFYPSQRIVTKYYEKNADFLAHQLWRKAYALPDEITNETPNYEKCSNAVYKAVEKFVLDQPDIDIQDKLYSPTYAYNRKEVNNKFAKAHNSEFKLI